MRGYHEIKIKKGYYSDAIIDPKNKRVFDKANQKKGIHRFKQEKKVKVGKAERGVFRVEREKDDQFQIHYSKGQPSQLLT